MSRARNRLTAIQVKTAGDGQLIDGGGLMLVRKNGRGKWIYRFSIHGRRRDMGLGAQDDLTLAAARKERDRWEEVVRDGKDPIIARQDARDEAAAASRAYDPTFADAVDTVFEAREATLKRGGKAGRWRSPLDLYMIPKIGKVRVSRISPTHIKDALKPIWRTKHPTAIKAYRRTRITLRHARMGGADCHEEIVEKAVALLGAVKHVSKHIEATPWQRVPELYAALGDGSSVTAALRFAILTLVRSDAVRGARFSEIEDHVWTVSAERVKATVAHAHEFRVPLSGEAQRIVELCRDRAVDDFLFPGMRAGKRISDQALTKHLDTIREAGRVHGFRTSFKTWVMDTDAMPWEVAETTLDHKIGGAVERSYSRSDLLDRRHVAMEAWARFVTGASSNVVQLGGG